MDGKMVCRLSGQRLLTILSYSVQVVRSLNLPIRHLSCRDSFSSAMTKRCFWGSSSLAAVDPAETDTTAAMMIDAGTVIRVAARSYHPEKSKPRSAQYTTRKVERDEVQVLQAGCLNDYNHYRTIALNNTLDRALSIVTTDSLDLLKGHLYPVRPGDLGENVLVDGVDHTFFVPGRTYLFAPPNKQMTGRDDTTTTEEDYRDEATVIVEITEPIQPCANLCKLPYINDQNRAPKERIATCEHFLSVLEDRPGLRGWYAKVLKEGTISKQCEVTEFR